MRARTWHCGPFDFDLSTPVVMGICNVTPDSFSDGGMHATAPEAFEHARGLLAAGADIIDVGGESTRPGAEEVPPDVELERVLPVVRELAAQGVAVSVDTRHASVAAACIDAGACIINDVSGFRSLEMRELAARSDVGLVVMHMRGTPKTMQEAPVYDDVVLDVEQELSRMAARLSAEGIAPERICLDFGIGFGKNIAHNLALVQATAHFADLDYPLMAAVSRKSFIGAMSAESAPAMRDRASALCAAFMAGQGARILRVHNVAATREMLRDSHRAIIALGSNMGNSCGHLDDALASLRLNPDVWVGAVSEYVTSEPAYLEAQAPFVNAVALIQTTFTPHELLHMLQSLEAEHGRVRSVENGPRPLDLDIIDYEGVVCADEQLDLPHPLALERDFVVTPLLDIMPSCELANGIAVTRDKATVGQVMGPARDMLA
mgnify:FL=1